MGWLVCLTYSACSKQGYATLSMLPGAGGQHAADSRCQSWGCHLPREPSLWSFEMHCVLEYSCATI